MMESVFVNAIREAYQREEGPGANYPLSGWSFGQNAPSHLNRFFEKAVQAIKTAADAGAFRASYVGFLGGEDHVDTAEKHIMACVAPGAEKLWVTATAEKAPAKKKRRGKK